MKIIGLTGPSGAGKGELGRCFERRGASVIDTDHIYHELLLPPSPCLDELVLAFGKDILTTSGTLDRTKMAGMVFGSDDTARERRATLNRITHNHVIKKTNELLAADRAANLSVAVIDAPLLFEAGMDSICDLVIAVLADRKTRMARLHVRDGKSHTELSARLDSQPDDNFYRSHADIVIVNNGCLGDLQSQADAALRRAGIML